VLHNQLGSGACSTRSANMGAFCLKVVIFLELFSHINFPEICSDALDLGLKFQHREALRKIGGEDRSGWTAYSSKM
jgi:hypothetical protein